jgi:formyltetrahydrofolate deformylase
MPHSSHVLTLNCANRPGIVAAVAGALFEAGGDIREAQQFDDTATNRFFMRVVFDMVPATTEAALRETIGAVGQRFDMAWTLRDRAVKRRVILLVSKFDHCLVDLLYRWRIGEMRMDIAGIISNHPRETYAHLDLDGIPFHHLPVTRQTKMEQEAEMWRLFQDSGADLMVLARYMQVLSDGLGSESVRPLHQHPPFLPARLQRGAALPPGACARGEADRRDGAFRHRRPG